MKALGSNLCNKQQVLPMTDSVLTSDIFVNKLEALCQNRALKAFGLSSSYWSVNVQPMSVELANLAVYKSLMGSKKDGKIMSVSPYHGG